MASTQYHLTGKGFSGRAVRVRELTTSEVEENLTQAAKFVSSDASLLELKKVEWRNGVKRFVESVTEPTTDPMTAKWKKVSCMDLEDLGKYFKAKDQLALEAIYREFHEVVPSELEAITGKALPVASEG